MAQHGSRHVPSVVSGLVESGSVLEVVRAVNDRRLRVLVVEDEGLIRWAVAEALTGGGHTVLEACNAEEARRTLSGVRPPVDIVLLDYRLPDSSDLDLLRDIRRLSPRSAVVMMTAFGARDLSAAAVELGAHSVIDKPFDLHGLELLLRTALHDSSPAAA
jgi:DNA-binding NtrC family response regulator